MQSVEKGTAAAKAGIHGGSVNTTTEDGQVAVGGDIIVKIDGKEVASSEALANDIEEKKPGEKITIELLRGNGKGGYEHKTVTATLGQRPNSVRKPEHARRLQRSHPERARYRWRAHVQTSSPREDLRHHQPRRRRAGGRAGRVGARDDLL